MGSLNASRRGNTQRRLVLALLFVLAALAGPARAEMDADSEAARRRFARGSELYGESRYAEALAKFEEARAFKPLPAFDYNIGRCLDRLERWAEAVSAYERFLAAAPTGPEADEIRARVEILRARVIADEERQAAALRAAGRSNPLRGAAIGLTPTALALGIGGGVLLGLAAGSHDQLEQNCRFRPCTSDDWQNAERQAIAGYSLLAVAGAVAIVDVGLWIAQARRAR